MNRDLIVAIVIISFILPILAFFLGYYYSNNRIHNSMIKAKVKLCELDIKLKEAHLKKMNSEINNIFKEDNPDVEVFKIPLGDEKKLNEILSRLEKGEHDNSDKEE